MPWVLRRRIAGLAGVVIGAAALAGVVAAAGQTPDSIWVERAPLLDSNSEFAVAQIDSAIYVMGGYPSTRVYVNTVQVYDGQTDRWQYGAPLPQPMHHNM